MGVIPLAVTGGVAEGKTTVLRVLAEMGLRTLSADDVAKEVVEDPFIQSLVQDELEIEGPLDRNVLRDVVARHPEKRRVLNKILHPEILTRICEARPDAVEVPLLVETCIQALFTRVWIVTCGEDEQLRRLESRLGDRELASKLIQSQLSFEIKRCFADQIVRTDQPLDRVVKTVEKIGRALGH